MRLSHLIYAALIILAFAGVNALGDALADPSASALTTAAGGLGG